MSSPQTAYGSEADESQITYGPQETPGFVSLEPLAAALDGMERTRIENENRLRNVLQMGGQIAVDPDAKVFAAVVDGLAKLEHDAVLALQRAMRRHPLAPFVAATPGLGEKQMARHAVHGVELAGHSRVLQAVDLIELPQPQLEVGTLRLHRLNAVVVTELEPLPNAHRVRRAGWFPVADEEPKSDKLLFGRARNTGRCCKGGGQVSAFLLLVVRGCQIPTGSDTGSGQTAICSDRNTDPGKSPGRGRVSRRRYTHARLLTRNLRVFPGQRALSGKRVPE